VSTKKDALKAEALEADTVFEYDGETYTIPHSKRMPLAFLEALEDGKLVAATKVMLGPEQYATFNSKPRVVSDLNDMLETSTKAAGGTPMGESSAS
jgi:hypothetical protein